MKRFFLLSMVVLPFLSHAGNSDGYFRIKGQEGWWKVVHETQMFNNMDWCRDVANGINKIGVKTFDIRDSEGYLRSQVVVDNGNEFVVLHFFKDRSRNFGGVCNRIENKMQTLKVTLQKPGSYIE